MNLKIQDLRVDQFSLKQIDIGFVKTFEIQVKNVREEIYNYHLNGMDNFMKTR